jgi:hypothetical protein
VARFQRLTRDVDAQATPGTGDQNTLLTIYLS